MCKNEVPKTLEEIEALPKDFLVPKDIAAYLRCNPYTINIYTRNGENPFPFPIIRLGNRVRIPKVLFLKAMRGESVSSAINSGAKPLIAET